MQCTVRRANDLIPVVGALSVNLCWADVVPASARFSSRTDQCLIKISCHTPLGVQHIVASFSKEGYLACTGAKDAVASATADGARVDKTRAPLLLLAALE